ncbi:UDP-N-acetylmuramoyl-L-alanyl-D-glutamate--2,6-diaminopimelate ligase [Lacticigenium naphthae]|uniref:UDP-N-acetylmuramoyl-L-alanyl-D-glutamate--2, 6-diaminopimelate ligase n=1 Tax=Lacticigenium naphthae TaxID=515351 RepID=UPI0003FB399F|nr:UDP-N-acetylmuramoyl-L-alanyl-D-glutamate--2,6-diaminopimelate ligase [Lacticigenium naphthae]
MKINFQKEFDRSLIRAIYGKPVPHVSSLEYNSKNVKQYTAFFCIPGEKFDGHQFIEDALTRGASVIIGTQSQHLRHLSFRYPETTFILVYDVKYFMARFSAVFYNSSYTHLSTFAVTGTNGKTTVVSYIRSLLNYLGVPTGSIGTAGIWDDQIKLDLNHSTHTTPEAPDLHRALDTFYTQKLKAVAIEVTSIALEQQRVADMLFDVGIHTNLTPEHLDFHSSFEEYKQAKLKLFRQVKTAVVNLDDLGMAQDILHSFEGPLLTYSLIQEADVMAQAIETRKEGTDFELRIHDFSAQVHSPIYGAFNVSNLLAAICACLQLNIAPALLAEAVEEVGNTAGRFEVFDHYADYTLILDFAHTPSGLESVVKTAQDLPHNRLILLITGVGLRDPRQRPQLARAVEGKADEIIVSVDHPHFFDRQMIADDVLKGFQGAKRNVQVILQREEAIHAALSQAQAGDIVLLTGLGSGGYQVIEGQNIPYSDEEVIQRYFQE